jgi:hypothetical protein
VNISADAAVVAAFEAFCSDFETESYVPLPREIEQDLEDLPVLQLAAARPGFDFRRPFPARRL